jgi:aspartate/methionine/tyrosine aminotransferase
MFRNNTIVSKRAKEIPASGIRKMFAFANRYSDVTNLSLGEPDFCTPPHVIEAAVKAMNNGFTHYTPSAGVLEFRTAASEKLKVENRIEADPATEVIATVGAMGALSLAMLTIIDPGDEVLIPDPGYANYEAQVLLAGGKTVHYELREECNFHIRPEELKNLITHKTRAIVINSPSNPTGAVFDERELRGIAEIALRNDLVIISDESYESIIYDGVKHISIASFPEMKQRTISIFSLSKTHAMTGWRIGYAVANEEVIMQMAKLQEHISAHPSSISQFAAIAALRGPKEHVNEMLKEYMKRRDIILKEINAIPSVRCHKPEGAFYVFPNVRGFGLSSTEIANYILENARVVVVPGTAFGGHGEGHIRISYTAPSDTIYEAMVRMRSAIEKLMNAD